MGKVFIMMESIKAKMNFGPHLMRLRREVIRMGKITYYYRCKNTSPEEFFFNSLKGLLLVYEKAKRSQSVKRGIKLAKEKQNKN